MKKEKKQNKREKKGQRKEGRGNDDKCLSTTSYFI